MYLTVENLKKNGACGQGLKWFERTFPNGAELADVINHKYADKHFLHWGYANLTTTEEDKEIYRKKLKIECGEANYSVYESDNITNSIYVTHSSWVKNSDYIFYSKDVEKCHNVLRSSSVENSTLIYGSDFVYDSNKIINGKNINNSTNTINSDYVIESHHVYNAISVKNSAYIIGINPTSTKQIKHSYFIGDCQNLDHCLFCFGLENQSYQIFNRPLDEIEYSMIIKQMQSVLKDWEPELVSENKWPANIIPLDSPIIQRNIIKQYANLPDTFWRWVKTLPYYDPQVIYSITYNPKAFD